MSGGEWLWWLPIAAVLAMSVLGLLAARGRLHEAGRRRWLIGIAACGAAAVALTGWQQVAGRAALQQETARLQELGARLDGFRLLLPQTSGASPDETFDTIAAAIRALNARIEGLQDQVRAAQEKYRTRNIEPETAASLAAFLRQSGPHRVVVSTVPDDVEAFTYANQIVNILRGAGWEAVGPETTAIFGKSPSTGIKLFARDADASPEAAKTLIAAFTRFNIPFASGVAPSAAIPDPATVELFVSPKA